MCIHRKRSPTIKAAPSDLRHLLYEKMVEPFTIKQNSMGSGRSMSGPVLMGARRCVLHIGICKTGTTAIQYWLAANSSVLNQAGLALPVTLALSHNHRHLTLLAVEPGSVEAEHEWNVLRQRNSSLNTCRTFEQARKWVEESLRAELEMIAPEKWVVFSSEQLSQRLLRDSEVYRLREAMERLGFGTVKIIVYVREQVGLKMSWDSMKTIAGQRKTMPEDLVDHFNHQELLERWERAWGNNALLVRTYARKCLEQGDIVSDFITHALPVLPADELLLASQPRRNERLGERGIWLMRLVNRWLPKLLPERSVEPIRSQVLRCMKSRWLSGKQTKASAIEIEAIKMRYEQSNRWVDRKYNTKINETLGST